MNWAVSWAITRQSLGRDPTVEQVAERWSLSRRAALREQDAFRAAFPMLQSPATLFRDGETMDLLRQLAADGDEPVARRRFVMRLPTSWGVILRIPAEL
jgi:hypothetical protein